jgi:hypothetical protein
MTPGLTRVPTDTLVRVLRLVHHGELACPFTPVGLVNARLQDVGDDLGILRGLDRRAVVAVLVSVIAERRALTAAASP